MRKIRVIIVEDDLNWVKLISKLLQKEEDIEIVGTAYTKEEAINLASEIESDIMLMDINLSGNKADGIYAAAEICEHNRTKVIMLTSMDEEELIKNSFIAGAVNYISKADFKEIPVIIRKTYTATTPVEIILKDYRRLKEEEQLNVLTYAEKEVFELIEEGYTKEQIMENLYKSENTIRNQISSILKKLGVKSSKEAIRKVRMRGIFK